ncbi:MAG: CDP-alcohol phosphatidyltransferase family protein [Planctomycetota bacterium]
MDPLTHRRPLKSRSTGWARRAARMVAATGLSPNGISTVGIGFAALGAWALIQAPDFGWPLWLAAAACIQLRLLMNLLDGMVAVEGGRQSATGALFNEAPDRIEDSLLLVAAGYAGHASDLGWCAALLALATAWARAFGTSLGFEPDFCGPMAKPHRMAALTVGALACIAWPADRALPICLWAIVAGAAWTFVRRVLRIHRLLQEQ